MFLFTDSGGDDVQELTAVRLRNLPDEANNKTFLRNFYSKFGEIKRVYCHLPTKSSIITFADHVSNFLSYLSKSVSNEMSVEYYGKDGE